MAEETIIYGKAGWPYTDQALSAYGKKAKYIDVKSDSAKLQEMLKISGGVRQVPVIVEGDKVTIGHGGTWGVWRPIGNRSHTETYKDIDQLAINTFACACR